MASDLMSKGDFLDTLVRETFNLIRDSTEEIKPEINPNDTEVYEGEYSKGLTDYLVKENILSKNYKVVLSKKEKRKGSQLGDIYKIVIYNDNPAGFRSYDNVEKREAVDLSIYLSDGDMKTMNFVSARYFSLKKINLKHMNFSEDGSKFTEEEKLSINPEYNFVEPDGYLFGKISKMLDEKNKPIKKNLAEHSNDLTSHTEKTLYRYDKNPNTVQFYHPVNK